MSALYSSLTYHATQNDVLHTRPVNAADVTHVTPGRTNEDVWAKPSDIQSKRARPWFAHAQSKLHNGVRPDPGKVRVINEWPTPSNVKELRQFLKLATYLFKYASNDAGKIRPLSQLLKKDAERDWTAECQQVFDAVKQGLTEAPILAVADQDRPFQVMCDASDFAIGCALMQHDSRGTWSCGLLSITVAEAS
ncbi:unnamed protein product [Phytophthora fragariaefolia]|uniref:Unnamed protein product n=1 Tax=Phytophthora fragariaefolia TaxID=1490495 RepID=A0A9W7D2E6_9STRA|nr:unnamed protein product [Phytophthora fragariaefolia]